MLAGCAAAHRGPAGGAGEPSAPDAGVERAAYPSGAIATLAAGIAIFPPNPSATTKPLTTLAGAWQTGYCEGLAFGPAHQLYALCNRRETEPSSFIAVFASGASGSASPVNLISGPRTRLDSAVLHLTVDAQGFLYVIRDTALNGCGGSLLVFAPDADGDAPPLRELAGDKTEFSCSAAVAVDASGQVYVGNAEGGPVLVFSADADGNAAPIRRIGNHDGELGDVTGLAFDRGGNLYVAEASMTRGIVVYASDASEGSAPVRVIAGDSTGLLEPTDVAVDEGGRTVVPDPGGHIISPVDDGKPDKPRSLRIFAPSATGDIAPQTILEDVDGDGLAIAP